MLNTNVGSQSASQCRLAIVPDFVPVPGIAKDAEGKYQVIDEGDLRDGPEESGIAAHRDSFFRGLKDVALGDRIELAALHQKFVYTVDNIAVVTPSDVSVLQARSQPSLTLMTCYSFYFVGGAPRRYVVQASLVDSEQTTISELNQEIPKPNKEKTK